MLAAFDWLRLARSGAELLGTLRYLETYPELPAASEELAPPVSALCSPCERCCVYPREAPGKRFCAACREILAKAHYEYQAARYMTVVWGFVTQLPRQLRGSARFPANMVMGSYTHDAQHFLLALPRQQLKPWLQEFVLYNGADLNGFLQIFPGTGGKSTPMNDLLIRVVHHETRFPPDRLRVRFLAAPHYIYHLHEYDREGVLTFEVGDFLSTLEMAAVFRSLLLPDEQAALHELLKLNDDAEAQFYWGRFLTQIKPEVKDMLNAWRIRRWSRAQVDLLYHLSDYVRFY